MRIESVIVFAVACIHAGVGEHRSSRQPSRFAPGVLARLSIAANTKRHRERPSRASVSWREWAAACCTNIVIPIVHKLQRQHTFSGFSGQSTYAVLSTQSRNVPFCPK